MVATSIAIDDRPSAFRFPRGNGIGVDMAANGVGSDLKGQVLEIGKGVVRREGTDIAVVGYGQSVNQCLAAAEMLSEHGISVTVEDASSGGFGSHVMNFLALEGLLGGNLKFRPMC